MNKVFPAIDTVVQEAGAIPFDFHTPFLDSVHLFPDFLHPGLEGSRQMAEILFNMMINSSLISQVDAGEAHITDFNQVLAPVAVGAMVEL